jgi:predicted RNA binding protein YcfA (HicA-like mRNA interferase family)
MTDGIFDHRRAVIANMGRVTVAGKSGDDVLPKTLASIFRQTQMNESKNE